MQMKVSAATALSILRSIPHERCQTGIATRWRTSGDEATAQSVLWLYCWAVTGMGSTEAASSAQRAFDAILVIPYGRFASRVPHDWAQHNRYSPRDIEHELRHFLDAETGNDQPDAPSSLAAKRTGFNKPPPRTLEGLGRALDAVADTHLGVCDVGSSTPHHRHKTSALRLSKAPAATFDAAAMLADMLDTAERLIGRTSRFEAKGPSAENWRFTQRPDISLHNASPETTLERAIIRGADNTWANQVPTASGLLNSTQDRHRNIDLVNRMEEGRYEFIELKVNSDHPLRAAIQLLQYAVLYVFARRRYAPDLVQKRPLLQAREITLTVLAPATYYTDYDFAWLEDALDRGAASLGRAAQNLKMSFRFQAFPADFIWPDSESDPGTAMQLRSSVAGTSIARSSPDPVSATSTGRHKRHLAEWASHKLPPDAIETSPSGSILLRPQHRHLNYFRPTWSNLIAGKVHKWGHALNSSQAFAVNLFGPLADQPETIAHVLKRLWPELPLDDGDTATVKFEHTPAGASNWLGERGQPTQVDVYFSFMRHGRPVGALLVEVKFLERAFGQCRGWDGGSRPFNRDRSRCLSLQQIVASPSTCAMAAVEGRRYWSIMTHPDSGFGFAGAAANEPCPFRHGLYQVMRNCALADALRLSGSYSWTRTAVCVHADNTWATALPEGVCGEGDLVTAFNRLRRRDPLLKIDAGAVADAVVQATTNCGWRDWFEERYRT